jgi:hypothetical protein
MDKKGFFKVEEAKSFIRSKFGRMKEVWREEG